MTAAPFDPVHYEALASTEQRHFWFVHRNDVIRLLLRHVDGGSARRVLEVGCGTGNVLGVLAEECPKAHVYGLELFGEGLRVARGRSAAGLVQGSLEHLPFRVPFDVVALFDVLEHIAADRQALEAARGALSPTGHLVVTVPAYSWLWSAFDVAAGHVRRYSPPLSPRRCRKAASV